MVGVARRAASSSPRLSWGVAAAGAGAGGSTVGSAAAGGGRGKPIAAITLLDVVYAFLELERLLLLPYWTSSTPFASRYAAGLDGCCC